MHYSSIKRTGLSATPYPFLIALFFLLSTSCFGQTPEKIIQDYLHAEGGAKALAKVQSLTISGNLRDGATDETGSYSLITKAPSKLYSEIVIEPDRNVVSYNGKSSWGQDFTTSPHTLTGTEAAESEAVARYLNGHLLDAKKDKLGEKFVGVENVRGRQAYRVELLLAPGITRAKFSLTRRLTSSFARPFHHRRKAPGETMPSLQRCRPRSRQTIQSKSTTSITSQQAVFLSRAGSNSIGMATITRSRSQALRSTRRFRTPSSTFLKRKAALCRILHSSCAT